jgi:hypothetical protein
VSFGDGYYNFYYTWYEHNATGGHPILPVIPKLDYKEEATLRNIQLSISNIVMKNFKLILN